jgi:dolichyl-phosphate mannosyltransferase polypeptide 2 regulatory subunit
MSAKAAGLGFSVLSVLIFTYYTTWALVLVRRKQPLLETSSPLHAFFLPRRWAFLIPQALLLAFLAFVGGFFVYASRKASSKKKEA